jgi:hypothetical protein
MQQDPKRRDLDFADDIVLLGNNIKLANEQLEQLRVEAAKVGLIINEKKTEVMTFNSIVDVSVRIVDANIESKINSFATTCYRALLGLKWSDRVPNEDIRVKVGRRPLINEVRRRQLGWLGHVLRRHEDEPAAIFALYVPEHGTAKRGKPPLTYLKQIASLLTNNPEHLTVEKSPNSQTTERSGAEGLPPTRRKLID